MEEHLWLDGMTEQEFKDKGYTAFIDGCTYHYDNYDDLIKRTLKLKVGDYIINPYTKEDDKIKTIEHEWYQFNPAANEGNEDVGILEIVILTEKGYLVYDINDCVRDNSHNTEQSS